MTTARSGPAGPPLGPGWALLPLFFFGLSTRYYLEAAHLAGLLWLCHVSNLGMAIGIAARFPELIRVTALFMVAVTPPWLLDCYLIRTLPTPGALLIHFGGAAVGLYATRAYGSRRGIWKLGMVWFLGGQLVSRIFTDPVHNINFAHRIWTNWDWLFRSFAGFWVSLFFVMAIWLRVVEAAILGSIPPPDARAGGQGDTARVLPEG